MHDVARSLSAGGTTSPPDDFLPQALVVEMQSSSTLLTVLTTLARLGCRMVHVFATERRAALGVLAPGRISHRVVPCLRELVEVLDVVESAVAPEMPTVLGAVA